MQKNQETFMAEPQSDKQLRRSLISMLASIVLCISCLVGTTWAWIQTSITNEGNVITVGELRVSVELAKGEKTRGVTVVPSEKYTYVLEEVGEYCIVLMNTGSIPGHCTITLTDSQGNSEEFTSGTLYPAGEGQEDTATIILTITAEDILNDVVPVELKIQPYWGDDPNYAIVEVDEELFQPTEETTEATEETLDEEDPEGIMSTDPTEPEETVDPEDPEAPSQPTEPDETEPVEPEAPESSEPESGEPEEPTTEPTQPTEGEPETQPDPTETTQAP